jgi:hypothetical protein
MRAKLQGTFDLTARMPAKSEDDVKTERILMLEMKEVGPSGNEQRILEEYKAKMRRDNALKLQHNRRNDE